MEDAEYWKNRVWSSSASRVQARQSARIFVLIWNTGHVIIRTA
jgi:hypothetical protein